MKNAYLSNTLQYRPELCNGCRMCIVVCPHAVFEPNDGAVQPVHAERCIECGACQLNCPTGAIEVDSGVGCATALMLAAITGKKEATCGCGGGGESCGSEEE